MGGDVIAEKDKKTVPLVLRVILWVVLVVLNAQIATLVGIVAAPNLGEIQGALTGLPAVGSFFGLFPIGDAFVAAIVAVLLDRFFRKLYKMIRGFGEPKG